MKSNNSFPELLEVICKNGLEKNPVVMGLLSSYAHKQNPDRLNQLNRILNPLILIDLIDPDPFLPYPSPEEIAGVIPIGRISKTDSLLKLMPAELMQGSLIAGRPGAGKTTLCQIIAEFASRAGINFLALDIKQDYRHMIRRKKDILVFRPSDRECNSALLFNPLYTKIDPYLWNQTFSSVTAEAHNVYDGTENYIFEHLKRLYREYDTENTRKFPTILELYEEIKADKHSLITRDARYRESALNRFNSIMHSLGISCGYRKGYDINSLLEKYSIVMEFHSHSYASRIFLNTLVLAQIFFSRIRIRNQKPIIIIIDEANDIFNRELERKRGTLAIAQLARQAREFLLGIIASCQIPVALCDSVLNTYTTILFNEPDGKNLDYVARSMQLTEEQKAMNAKLRTGQAIVRTARLGRAVRIEIPRYPVEKNVTDEEVEMHMASFVDELRSHVEKDESADTHVQYKREAKNHEETEPKKEVQPVKNKKDASSGITEEEKSFLMDIYIRPYLSITGHYENLGISVGKGHRIVKILIRKQFCTIAEINLGGRGGLTKFLVLIEEGYAAIGMKSRTRTGRGAGFEHEFWQNKFSEQLKATGCKTEVEKNLNGKFIDVAIETSIGIVALEVAISPEHEKENIEKDFAAGCISMIIACKDQKVKEAVEEIIQTSFPGKTDSIKICLAYELLKNNFFL